MYSSSVVNVKLFQFASSFPERLNYYAGKIVGNSISIVDHDEYILEEEEE
jgi:hypothetical protein